MNLHVRAFDLFSHGILFAFPLSLLAGAVAALNPCCVAIYPSAAATWCGVDSAQGCSSVTGASQRSTLMSSIAFVFGIAAANTVLGLCAALAGRFVGQLGVGFRYVVAMVPLMMGLHLIGWLRLPINSHTKTMAAGWFGAFGVGFLLSVAITPCGTPILASMLSYVAYKRSLFAGGTLLFAYGIGFGIPAAVVATTAGRLLAKLKDVGYQEWAERIAGAALIGLAFWLLWEA